MFKAKFYNYDFENNFSKNYIEIDLNNLESLNDEFHKNLIQYPNKQAVFGFSQDGNEQAYESTIKNYSVRFKFRYTEQYKYLIHFICYHTDDSKEEMFFTTEHKSAAMEMFSKTLNEWLIKANAKEENIYVDLISY